MDSKVYLNLSYSVPSSKDHDDVYDVYFVGYTIMSTFFVKSCASDLKEAECLANELKKFGVGDVEILFFSSKLQKVE